jgi:ABC-type transport system involved in multi-copper enzyme maturation permease subunit
LLWWPITRWGIKLIFQKKFFKIFIFFSLFPAILFLAGIYVSERLEDFQFMIQKGASFLKINPQYFHSYFTNNFLFFSIVVLLVFCASGLMADDIKYRAMQLYFSRPLKRKDYFIGKIAITTFFLFILTLIPGLILFIMKLVFSGSFQFIRKFPWLILSIIGYSFVVTLFFSLYALLLSSVSKDRRYAAVLIFGIYYFSDILSGILFGIFRERDLFLFSLKVNLSQIGAMMFGQSPKLDAHWIFSFFILGSICVIAAVILSKKIRGIEVFR